MGQVKIHINGRDYEIACDDGEENHVQQLGHYVDEKVAELATRIGQVGDTRLLLMAALLITDELSEAFSKLEDADSGAQQAENDGKNDAAENITLLAQRIDGIAAGLERG
jgi:cell division protein ZapA